MLINKSVVYNCGSTASPLVSVPYLCYASDLRTCICDAQSDDGMTCMSSDVNNEWYISGIYKKVQLDSVIL